MKTVLALLSMAAAAAAQDFKFENKPDNLKAYLVAIQGRIESDAKTAAAMTRALVCDEARLKKAIRDDAAKDMVDKLLAGFKPMLEAPDDKVAPAFKVPADRSECTVHGATTEEIARYEKDSVAYKEFPGGAQKLAASLLRAGVTFYEVEFCKPGEDAGTKYHLFFWDGEKWAMLGAAWRALPK